MKTTDFFGNGTELPQQHPDRETDLEVKVQALSNALDTARTALARAAAMQVVMPKLEEIKTNAAWAMRETSPGALFGMDDRDIDGELKTSPKSQLGGRIRELRQAAGLTIQKLADLSEISKSYLWGLENGDSPSPSVWIAAMLAKALGVTVEQLVTGEFRLPAKGEE